MAGMMDKAKDKMSDMGDQAGDRMEQLKAQAKDGTLSDKGKQELEKLKGRSDNRDSQ